MLAFAFFVSVFSTLTWLIYAVAYINDHLNDVSFSSLGLADISIYLSLVLLPIFILWMVFGYINSYLTSKVLANNMFSLFKQMKKNQDYTDLIARIMLEAEQEIKDGFILNKFDLFVADMNELLADLIQRCNIASAEQIERLWTKVQNGGKWAFGKVLIEVNQNQSNFQMRVFEKSQQDNVIAGTVLEWCARYLSLIALLEKHDKERVFLNIIETGVFGKVFSIMAPISDEVRRSREFSGTSKASVSFHAETTAAAYAPKAKPIFAAAPTEESSPVAENSVDYPNEKSFVSKINPFRKKNPHEERYQNAEDNGRDPFSMALERSFGSESAPEEPKISAPVFEEESLATEIRIEKETYNEPSLSNEPKFEISMPEPQEEAEMAAPFVEKEERVQFNNTQKTLKDLKKEWEVMRAENAPVVEEPFAVKEPQVTPQRVIEKVVDEDYSYPFGGWTDESNYNK